MSCSHCPHCRARAEAGSYALPGPPRSNPSTGTDLQFYATFAAAYDRARAAKLRPRQTLTAANPWMSDSQCSSYLKRARALGLVTADQRARPAPQPEPQPAPQTQPTARRRSGRLASLTGDQCASILFSGEEDMELLLDNALQGRSITPDKLRRAHTGKLSEREAADVLQWAVNAGHYEWQVPGESILPPS